MKVEISHIFRIKYAILLITVYLYPSIIQGQISTKGTPPSFLTTGTKLKSGLKTEIIIPPDIKKLQAEDKINDSLNRPYRIAYMIPAELCMNYTGNWDTLSTGEIIWRLKITSPGALALQLEYDNFYLPKGSKLFLYSEDKKFVIGAFTEQNNDSSGLFATEIIPGETTILEYVQGNTKETPRICISRVGYVYRGLDIVSPNLKSLKDESGSCEVNVRCSPEGDNWTDVKRAVARVIIGGYVCSGTLLNNTAQDFKNLFSTAFHCIDGQESKAAQYMFYFNYERSTCSNTSNIVTQSHTATGANIRAAIPLNNGSDGVLLEIYGDIPDNYNVYWAGWDVADTKIAGGACIHHPAGDVKKISTVRSYWTTDTWYGIDTVMGAKGGHWGVVFAQTANGYGVTEGGSSGSGIFGPDELFRGQLSGGTSSCSEPSGDNLYGKLSYSWDKYGTSSNLQFKTWLDPLNTGVKRLKGIDKNPQNGVLWTSSPPVIEMDSVVHFRDESEFNPKAWEWTFEGGTPSSSTSPTPSVQYTSPGLYDVMLKVTNDKGTFTKTRTDYIFVKPRPSWIEQNSRFPEPSRGIEGFSIIDSLNVWAWAFDGLNPSNQILEYTYTRNGGTTWRADSIVNPELKGYGISNLFAMNKDTVYAAVFAPNGGGKIIRTPNAGKTWQIQTTASFSESTSFPNFVYFFNKNEGVCVGDPSKNYYEIYTTANAGVTWTRVASANIPANLSGETGTTDMYDAKGDTIWFGTSNGRVYRSINKGKNWTVTNTGLSGRIDVRFKNSKIGFAIQEKENQTPFAMKKTINGGNTWQSYSIPANFKQGDLTYVSGTLATWVSVSGVRTSSGSSYSTDEGTSYTTIDSDIQYTAVDFYDKNNGWAGGFNSDSLSGGIYKWNKQNKVLTDIDDKIIIPDNKDKQFIIQPNPVRNIMKISAITPVLDNIKVSIVNMQGVLLDNFLFNGATTFQQNINVAKYYSGVYMIILQTGNKVETHKIIIE